MVYRNGFKEYAIMAVAFGVPMGIVYGLLMLDVMWGVGTGIAAGLLFSLLMLLFVKAQEKMYNKKRQEIAKERRIICDGGATVNGNGGWMFFTDVGLEFYPHKVNLSTEAFVIKAEQITTVAAVANQIVVITENREQYNIVVSKSTQWARSINAELDGRHNENDENKLD